MLEVLITSKTKWGTNYCIGGLELATGQFVRLMNAMGGYQPYNNPFEIGQVWALNYAYKPDKPPHVEDVRVTNRKYLRDIEDLNGYLTKKCTIWKGNYTSLYDGYLNWGWKGSGYLGNPKKLPNNSVGFWISDNDLIWDNEKYYIYKVGKFGVDKQFSYRGIVAPIPIIPKGTLIRVSLAKWLPSKYVEDRCYAQISGWY